MTFHQYLPPHKRISSQRQRRHLVLAVTVGIVIFHLCLFRSTVDSYGSLIGSSQDDRTLQSQTQQQPQRHDSDILAKSERRQLDVAAVVETNNQNDQPIRVLTETRGESVVQLQNDRQDLIAWRHELQTSSVAALEQMKERGALSSPFSTWESSIDNGFPTTWKPCSLHNLLEDKHKQQQQQQQQQHVSNDSSTLVVRVLILGGSCSARAADHCAVQAEKPLTGRYSDIVQKAMMDQNSSSSIVKFEFINLAQGSTNSILNGLTMDTLVDPTQTDILIWEFSPNELWGYNRQDPTKIQFWLARVQSLFQMANQPMPLILMIFLWQRNVGLPNRVHEMIQHGLGVCVQSALPTIQYYRQQHDWNIQAMSVGSTVVNLTALAANPKLLMDDEIHPGCHSVHLIADMIQYSILSNLATCTEATRRDTAVQDHDRNNKNNNTVVVAAAKPPLPPIDGFPGMQSMWGHMINPKARIASFTAWEPQPGGLSNLRLDRDSLPRDWKASNTEKEYSNREDRKMGYYLPPCNVNSTDDAAGLMNLTLLEPNLEWLGIGVTKRGSIRAYINGVEVDAQENMRFQYQLSMQYVRRWINVTEHRYNDQGLRRTNYTLSLCDTSEGRWKTMLRQVVGMMHPNEVGDTTTMQQ